jgi:hypothetical protein
MLHPTASQISVKHTPKQDNGRSIRPLINIETFNKEGAKPSPSLQRKLIEYSVTKLEESGQTAADWDTITRNPKHGGERSARHVLHPTAPQIYVKHTLKQ